MDLRVEGRLLELGDHDARDGRAELGDDVAEQVVGQRAWRGHAAHRELDGDGLGLTDENGDRSPQHARLLEHEHRRARLQVDPYGPECDLNHAASLDPDLVRTH